MKRGAVPSAKRTALRAVPSVESLLGAPELKALEGRVPRSVLVASARETLEALRESLRRGKVAGPAPDCTERASGRAGLIAPHATGIVGS